LREAHPGKALLNGRNYKVKKEMTTIRRIFLLFLSAIMLCVTGMTIVAQSGVADDGGGRLPG
jgi:hypothetical protein